MRGDIIFCVYGVHGGREKDFYFGAFRSIGAARAQVTKLLAREMHGRNWANTYHDQGFAIRELVVESDFEIPSRPKPRDRYSIKTSRKPNLPGMWDSTIVEVCRRSASQDGLERICEYERNHALYSTFEPFRQDGRDFALISRDYMRTAVLDLGTGAVIAEEAEGSGFCPIGFYVPDWWDVNDDSILPGSPSWSIDNEWPDGTFGFVWGCHWGDDSSWKVQWLDLSRVQDGIIGREERFGYLELGTGNYVNPCLTVDPPSPQGSRPPGFIEVSKCSGKARVRFLVEMDFDLASGASDEWQRSKIANLE